MSTGPDLWAMVAAGRRELAALIEGLDEGQLATQSLCSAWTVRDVAGHLLLPQRLEIGDAARELVRAKGNLHAANVVLSRRQAGRPVPELAADLRRFAGRRRRPPGFGPQAPLTEVVVHGLDIRVPLGLPTDVLADRARAVLDFLVTAKARIGGFAVAVPGRLVATDLGWSHGCGPEIRRPAVDLLLTLTGRA